MSNRIQTLVGHMNFWYGRVMITRWVFLQKTEVCGNFLLFHHNYIIISKKQLSRFFWKGPEESGTRNLTSCCPLEKTMDVSIVQWSSTQHPRLCHHCAKKESSDADVKENNDNKISRKIQYFASTNNKHLTSHWNKKTRN